MSHRKPSKCPENEPLVAYLVEKRQEIALSPKGICDNWEQTFNKAHSNICKCKTPIKTLKDLSKINGVGKWLLAKMKPFFGTDSGASENDQLTENGKKKKGPKRYVPQKNSAAYAILITLFRAMESGSEFMRKQELMDAADASGLSRVAIVPEKAKGQAGYFGSSPQDWYKGGWSCMKNLGEKGLVVKTSNPAKYMLTDEGKDVARICLSRSGLSVGNTNVDSSTSNSKEKTNINSDRVDKLIVDLDEDSPDVDSIRAPVGQTTQPFISSKKRKKSIDVPPEYIDKFVRMGYSEQQILLASSKVAETSPEKDIISLWPTILSHLKADEIYGSTAVPPIRDRNPAPSLCQSQDGFYASKNIETEPYATAVPISQKSSFPSDFGQSSTLRVGSPTRLGCYVQDHEDTILRPECKPNSLRMPPLTSGEKFGDVYEVVLILDNREKFAISGSRSRTFMESTCSQFKILIEVRRLPVGDAIWVARHKSLGSEYVLDFIVERKKVDDLRTSIRDHRYKEQKMRILRCGLKKMIYLVEGDPNSSLAAESIKTACFTTEILEGFDVQRTSGLGDTLKKYGHLTQAINQCYRDLDPHDKFCGVCPPFDEFIRECEELDKMTVSDVFAIQLMQVPQVTEDVALAVMDVYPTLLSLALAYSRLDGDISAQEEMLKRQIGNVINGSASRNIFQLVWGS